MTDHHLIVGLLIIALGVGILLYALRLPRTQAEDLVNSTNVLGTVTRVDIDSRVEDQWTTFYPVLEYEYEYLGDQYPGDNIHPGTDRARFGHREKSDAAAVIADFEVGEDLPVYVDSDDPTRAFVLREHTPMRIKQIALAGGMLFLFGLFILGSP